MKYTEINTDAAKAFVSSYEPSDGLGEYCVIAYATQSVLTFAEQLSELQQALQKAYARCRRGKPVFVRYFLSDAANQASSIGHQQCACSVIGQTPLMGSKVAAWAYLQDDVEVQSIGSNMSVASHGAYKHIWTADSTAPCKDSEQATRDIFEHYMDALGGMQCNLVDNCLRTWFFVRDIDANYHGMVAGRNAVFDSCGLTKHTHFIASTGIGGSNADTQALVTMDAYAVHGISPDQVTYLKAPTHLNPTAHYGVAFERATAIDYGDRRHVLVSGTASIDNRGTIMHPGDVEAQTKRMLENIEALLDEAQCRWQHVMHAIVYVRDICDSGTVRRVIAGALRDLPFVVVHAPVCRTGWLVEMECMAIRPAQAPYAPL